MLISDLLKYFVFQWYILYVSLKKSAAVFNDNEFNNECTKQFSDLSYNLFPIIKQLLACSDCICSGSHKLCTMQSVWFICISKNDNDIIYVLGVLSPCRHSQKLFSVVDCCLCTKRLWCAFPCTWVIMWTSLASHLTKITCILSCPAILFWNNTFSSCYFPLLWS